MTRYDPLSTLSPEPVPVAPPKRQKRAAPSPLVQAVAAVPDAMLAYLARRPAAEVRPGFTAFCQQHPRFTDWRQAWTAYTAPPVALPVSFDAGPEHPIPVVQASAAPRWQQACRVIAQRYT